MAVISAIAGADDPAAAARKLSEAVDGTAVDAEAVEADDD